MTAPRQNHLRLILIILFFFFVAGYSYFRLKDVSQGVKISIESLKNGITLNDPRINIVGQARHAITLSINDDPVPVDQKGNFSQALLLPPGYTVITVRAEDKFGKTDEKVYEVVYRE